MKFESNWLYISRSKFSPQFKFCENVYEWTKWTHWGNSAQILLEKHYLTCPRFFGGQNLDHFWPEWSRVWAITILKESILPPSPSPSPTTPPSSLPLHSNVINLDQAANSGEASQLSCPTEFMKSPGNNKSDEGISKNGIYGSYIYNIYDMAHIYVQIFYCVIFYSSCPLFSFQIKDASTEYVFIQKIVSKTISMRGYIYTFLSSTGQSRFKQVSNFKTCCNGKHKEHIELFKKDTNSLFFANMKIFFQEKQGCVYMCIWFCAGLYFFLVCRHLKLGS